MKGALSFSVRRSFHGAQLSTRKRMPTTDNLRVKNHWDNRNSRCQKMSGTRSFSHNDVSQFLISILGAEQIQKELCKKSTKWMLRFSTQADSSGN